MNLLQDVRYAVRLLFKDKWFTLVAVVALALGLGANNAVFTLVNAVLIRGLPFDDPDRILAIGSTDARGRTLGVSRLDFDDFRDGARAFSGLAIYLGTTINLSEEGRAPEQYQGSYGSSGCHFRSFRPSYATRSAACGAFRSWDGSRLASRLRKRGPRSRRSART